jgi:hypothetical protein
VAGYKATVRFTWDGFTHVNVAFSVHCHTFGQSEIVDFVLDRAIFRAADKQSLLVVLGDDVQRIVFGNEDTARRPELRALIDETSLLI